MREGFTFCTFDFRRSGWGGWKVCSEEFLVLWMGLSLLWDYCTLSVQLLVGIAREGPLWTQVNGAFVGIR